MLFSSLILLLLLYVHTNAENMERKLRSYIMNQKDEFIRPVKNPNDITNVTYNIRLQNILDLDQTAQMITCKYYVTLEWHNELIQWDPKEYGNISMIHDIKDMWMPHLVLTNSAQRKATTIEALTDEVYLFANGTNLWRPITIYTSSVSIDVTYFPVDMQTFELDFVSWDLNEHEIRLFERKVETTIDHLYTENAEWDVVNASRRISLVQLEFGRFLRITFSYQILRKPLFYITNMIIPCIILMVIVLTSYIIPADNGERMGVLITCLLAFAVFLEVVSDTLPSNSDAVSILSIFFIVTMMEATFAFFATGLVIFTVQHGKKNNAKSPPMWVKKYILRMQTKKEEDVELHAHNNFNFGIEKQEPTITIESGRNGKVAKEDLSKLKTQSLKIKRKWKSFNKSSVFNKVLDLQRITVQRLTAQMELKTAKIREQSEADVIELEWHAVAEVVDRISLCIFVIMFIIALGILGYGFNKYH